MFEVLVLLEHRSFVDVIVGGNAMVVCILGELSNVERVVSADVHVEKHHVPVQVLLLQQMLEVLANGHDRLWQTRLLVPGIYSEVKDRRACVAQPVSYVGAQQSAICSDVDPESFLRGVINHFVSKLRTQ